MTAYTDGWIAGQLGLTKVSTHVSPAFLSGYHAAQMNYDNPQEVRGWAADLTELWPSREEADAVIEILERPFMTPEELDVAAQDHGTVKHG